MKTSYGLKLLALALILSIGGFSVLGASGGRSDQQSDVVKEINFGINNAPADPTVQGAQKFKEVLENLSGGSIQVNIFPSAQLGDVKEMIEQVSVGELHMTMEAGAGLGFIVEQAEVLSAPYLFRDYEHILAVYEKTDFGRNFVDDLEQSGLLRLDSWYFGARTLAANKPISSIDDVQGLRLRIPQNAGLIAFAENIGAVPSPTPWGEVYLALQTGQVDAVEAPLTAFYAMKFYEVIKNVTDTNHMELDQNIFFSRDLWADFSEQEKQWIKEAVIAGREENNRLMFEPLQQLPVELEKYDVVVRHVERAPFEEAQQPFYADLYEKYGEELIEEIRSVR